MRRATFRATRHAFIAIAIAACTRAPAPAAGPSPTAAPAAPAAKRPSPLSRTRPVPTPAVPPVIAAPLPPIPEVDGNLSIKVVYPPPNHLLAVRDSTFIFGSVGSGKARLTINGADVAVSPNGAFLAWLPVPSPDKPRYELSASKGDEAATAVVPIAIRPLPMDLPDTGPLLIDHASIAPARHLMLRGDEPVRVALRAPANAAVELRTGDGAVHPLRRANGVSWSTEVPARDLAHGGTIIARRGHDSLTVPAGTVTLADAAPRRWVELLNSNEDATSDTDEVTIVRPSPHGTYKWFLFPGTVVELTGIRGDAYRIRLDGQLEAWVDERATRLLPESAAQPRRVAGNARVVIGDGFSDVRIPVGERPPYLVEERSDALVLTLYGVTSNSDIINLPTHDPSVRDVTWEQVATDRVRYTVHLRHPPSGYLVLWERNALVLRVRHRLDVSPDTPLAGRVIVVDPGHPPVGSTGPTGLYEGDAVLAVSQRLKALLEARGATVVMTRTTRDPVALGYRPILARRVDADAFVSVHLNALPDGVNPYRVTGSGTYFFVDQSEPLARAVQRGLVRELGLPDLGINYDNLAVVRQTWMPAVLCEGAFVIVPAQEAALRTVEFQERYALGIVEGLESYFRALAGEGKAGSQRRGR